MLPDRPPTYAGRGKTKGWAETYPPVITLLWRRIPDIYIDNDAEKARSWHDRECTTDKSIGIYKDESGIAGEIGAAAAYPLRKQIWSVYMGTYIVNSVCSWASRDKPCITNSTGLRKSRRQTATLFHLHRQPGSSLVHNQGRTMTRRFHIGRDCKTGPKVSGLGHVRGHQMDTSSYRNTRKWNDS